MCNLGKSSTLARTVALKCTLSHSFIYSQFTIVKSWLKACSLLLRTIRGLLFGMLMLLHAAITKWSLTSLQKTPREDNLWGTLVNIKSIKVDSSGLLELGLVVELTNWVRLIELKNLLNSSEVAFHQSQFKSPAQSSSV